MKDTHVDYTKDFMFGLDIIKEGMHKIGMWSLEGFGVQLKWSGKERKRNQAQSEREREREREKYDHIKWEN